jgi:hypothetical protein
MNTDKHTAAAAIEPEAGDRFFEIDRALALLSEAVAISDAQDLPPEIGARLEEVIDRLEQELEDRVLAAKIAEAFS